MSKHQSRKSRWIEVNPSYFVSLCGSVRCNLKGRWDAFVKYKKLHKDDKKMYYYSKTDVIGEFRRPREAMMAVEEKAVQINRQKGNGFIIELDQSLQDKR
jgi:hypothetical protein